MNRVFAILPLVLAVGVGLFAYWGLTGGRDPAAIPSVLVSKPVPDFALEAVAGTDTPGLSTADLQSDGLVLVNAFASWCGPCRAEHPVLTRMVEQDGIALMGLNYKDKPDAASAWLTELGNPYGRIGSDETGRAGIEWGLTGVPETYLIKDGVILYREAGPVVGDGLRRLQAAIAEARGQ